MRDATMSAQLTDLVRRPVDAHRYADGSLCLHEPPAAGVAPGSEWEEPDASDLGRLLATVAIAPPEQQSDPEGTYEARLPRSGVRISGPDQESVLAAALALIRTELA